MRGLIVILIILGLNCIILCGHFLFAEEQNGSEIDVDILQKYVYDADERPDPFIPLLEKISQDIDAGQPLEKELQRRMGDISVNGVFLEKSFPLVVINGKIYKENDTVNELLIEKIEENSVVLNFKGLRHTVNIINRFEPGGHGGTHEEKKND